MIFSTKESSILISDLKDQTLFNLDLSRESPPVKPIKSETVRAYVKSSGVSTSSVVDTYSSTTISENIDSEHETLAGFVNDSESDVHGLKKIHNETVNKQGGKDSETTKERFVIFNLSQAFPIHIVPFNQVFTVSCTSLIFMK